MRYTVKKETMPRDSLGIRRIRHLGNGQSGLDRRKGTAIEN